MGKNKRTKRLKKMKRQWILMA